MPTTVKPALEIDSQELADTFGIQAIPRTNSSPATEWDGRPCRSWRTGRRCGRLGWR